MFENIIGQGAVLQLKDDILNGRFAPSVLLYGPGDSGKSSTALELSRVLSCEENASWKCSCSSCESHRYLQHDDLLILGKRSFSAEIKACSRAFLRNYSVLTAKILFFRSLRKLQIRFSPVFMEDDPKMSKLTASLQSFDEKLNELWMFNPEKYEKDSLEKLCNLLIEDVVDLEKEISANIPIGHIRSASWWCRLKPNGKKKTLIIENAENMRDEARNSLLKLLEEPPLDVCIVLTAKRREVIMPTILSRLRPYRFLKRDIISEKEVIRLVFKDSSEEIPVVQGSLLGHYIESFAVQSTEKMYPLAAWFIVSLARIIVISLKKAKINKTYDILNSLGEFYAPIAETLNLERALKSETIIKTIMVKTGNFEDDSFSRFMKITMDLISDITRQNKDPKYIFINDIFKKYIGEAVTAVDVLNIKETSAMEAMIYNIKKAVKEG